MDKLKIELTQDETQTILNALSERPFKEVFAIIKSVKSQAEKQLEEADQKPVVKNGKNKG